MCSCGDNPIEVTHFPRELVTPQTTGLYWGYQHTNKTYKIKTWMPPYDGVCDRCVALQDMNAQGPNALIDAVFPVVRGYDQRQAWEFYRSTFVEHRLDTNARFAALLDEC